MDHPGSGRGFGGSGPPEIGLPGLGLPPPGGLGSAAHTCKHAPIIICTHARRECMHAPETLGHSRMRPSAVSTIFGCGGSHGSNREYGRPWRIAENETENSHGTARTGLCGFGGQRARYKKIVASNVSQKLEIGFRFGGDESDRAI